MNKKILSIISVILFLFANFAFAASSAYQKTTCRGNLCVLQVLWTSSAEDMPNAVDRNFSAASAWTNVDLGAYDESDDLTITAGAAGVGDYCTLPVASFPTTIGDIYTLTVDVANIAETWTVQSFDATQIIGTITANGTAQTLEWTAETTGGLRLVAGANDASADFDNFCLALSFNSFQTAEVNGFIDGVGTDPSATAAPKDNYDISIASLIVTTINETSTTTTRNICGDTGTWTAGEITTGEDGVLANRDTAVGEYTQFLNNGNYGGIPNVGPLLIDISNAGISKSGVFDIYYFKMD